MDDPEQLRIEILSLIDQINQVITKPKFILQNQQTKNWWTVEEKQAFRDRLSKALEEMRS